MKTIIYFSSLLFSLNIFAADFKSVYTDLDKDCVVASASTDKAPIDFYKSECKSFGGYRLTIEGGDLRYNPVLSYADQEIYIETPQSFHDMDSKKIEWIYSQTADENGFGEIEWKGLIYRLSESDIQDPDKTISRLYAIRLDGAKSCLIGIAPDNAKARELVYQSRPDCK